MLERSEIRGVDASGYWGVDKLGEVYYHKEPTRSGLFVRKAVWSALRDRQTDVMIVHARGASKGVGLPSDNGNNHPFTSSDRSLALVHNGRIDDCEYSVLKKKYAVKTDCDSEILIRIIQAAEADQSRNRLGGISDVFGLINHGHMAVAVAERVSADERSLWLFRNQHRPLWLVDLRSQLGQIFFMSEPAIWQEALSSCPIAKSAIDSVKVVELPPYEIWEFNIDQSQRVCSHVVRYMVQKGKERPWEMQGPIVPLRQVDPPFLVHTMLDDDDLIDQERYSCDSGLRLDLLNDRCDSLIDAVNDVRQASEAMTQDGLLSKDGFDCIVSSLDGKLRELEELVSLARKGFVQPDSSRAG